MKLFKKLAVGAKQMHHDYAESLGPPAKAGVCVTTGIEIALLALSVLLLSPLPDFHWLGKVGGSMSLLGGVIFFVGCCRYIKSGDSLEDLMARAAFAQYEMTRRSVERRAEELRERYGHWPGKDSEA